MTLPTIFGSGAKEFEAKRRPQGVLVQDSVIDVPSGTPAGTVLGVFRFQPGFGLVSLAIASDTLDSGTAVNLDVGFSTDSGTNEDLAAFLDDIDIAQDGGSRIWPVDDGLNTGVDLRMEEDGYITVTTRDAASDTDGQIKVRGEFSYDF